MDICGFLLFIDLETGSIEIDQWIHLSIERSRSLSESISISKYGRKNPVPDIVLRDDVPWAKGATILFLSSIVPIISTFHSPFWAPGWFVSSSYLRNSLSSFVIMLGEEIDINFVEGRLRNGDSPFSIEVGRAPFPTIPTY